MKVLFISSILLVSTSLFAKINFSSLSGYWKSDCIQTQINDTSGYVIEVYSFASKEKVDFSRSWFKDELCSTKMIKQDKSLTNLKIGKLSTNSFNPSRTYEIQFLSNKKMEKGLIWLSDSKKELRVSRGNFDGSQNTMLNIITYKKQ